MATAFWLTNGQMVVTRDYTENTEVYTCQNCFVFTFIPGHDQPGVIPFDELHIRKEAVIYYAPVAEDLYTQLSATHAGIVVPEIKPDIMDQKGKIIDLTKLKKE